MSELSTKFERAMIKIYKDALRECHYDGKIFLGMITDYGGVGAAKRLLSTDHISSGLATLAIYKRLDLTLEHYVIEPEFHELFTPNEIEIATRRINAYLGKDG